eukprot:m.7235 g.7235  ORF g.7235 m.7235 type:complete len:117 (-) comp2727_c0_seq1:278-628(-)
MVRFFGGGSLGLSPVLPVVYDNDATEAFSQLALELLMSNPKRILFLSLEHRINFSLESLAAVDCAYLHLEKTLFMHPAICVEELPTEFAHPSIVYERSDAQLRLWKIFRKQSGEEP